ncbi:hypothetical protein BCR43DRAFT_285011 [Syncephalastrum racemosum]|uniref:Uncharacterized protein n=1 Tax=Syncephalastrum racemosum TaxID=13706 RepID=A0A1X2HEG8_SYNRA|nr:hypothetical protein BCR43DRAFT_285011 [Syncephalastrum racemosum]
MSTLSSFYPTTSLSHGLPPSPSSSPSPPSRRFSSASVIAQLTMLGYPPKIQPQSSATRDQGRQVHTPPLQSQLLPEPAVIDYSTLDKVDEEAGCILIALSNHNSSAVVKGMPEKDTICSSSSSDSSSSSSASSSSSSSSTFHSDPLDTPSKSPSDGPKSMSISNLLGNFYFYFICRIFF